MMLSETKAPWTRHSRPGFGRNGRVQQRGSDERDAVGRADQCRGHLTGGRSVSFACISIHEVSQSYVEHRRGGVASVKCLYTRTLPIRRDDAELGSPVGIPVMPLCADANLVSRSALTP